MKVALYARVSTTDQNCEMQLRELRQYAKARGWKVADQYVDTGWSGAKASRPELDRMMADAARRQFDGVMVWKLDRFGRSVRNCIDGIGTLRGHGVRFLATSQSIDTDERNPAAQLLLHILAAIAEFERELTRERVAAGTKRYREEFSEGKAKSRSGKNLPVGRPKKVFRRDEANRMRSEGLSYRAIAKALGVPVMTVVGCTKTPLPEVGKKGRKKTVPSRAKT